LIWVAVDGALHLNHARRLTVALARGDIGLPTPADEEAMSAEIGRWLKIANVTANFAVDQPPRSGRLNVYFTTARALAATGVGYGNAAYDPSVDAIFIDRFFVDGSPYDALCTAAPESFVLGCREHMPSQKVMLAFVFFHELGHRQLHGVGSSAFASRPYDPQLRRMEAEADRFSLDQLKRAYALGQPVVADPDHALADAMGFGDLGDPELKPAYQVWVDILGTLTVSSVLNGFLPAPYSPFYHDLAHPSLFERTRGLIDVALADKSLPSIAANQFRFFQLVMTQEERIPDVPFVEVTVPEPVSNVTFTESELAALTVPRGAIYTAVSSTLRPDGPAQAPRVIAARMQIPGLKPASANLDFQSVDLFWGYGRSTFTVAGSGGDWRVSDQAPTQTAFPLPTNLCFHWWSEPSPASMVLAATCPDTREQLSVTTPTKVLGSTPVAGLEQAVREQLGDPALELELLKSGDRQPGVAVIEHTAYVPILKPAATYEQYRGILSLSLPGLQPAGIASLNLPRDLAEQQPASALFVARDAAGSPITLVVGGGGGLKPLHWGVWRVAPNGRVELLMERPFLLATELQSLSPTTISDFDPYLVEVRDLGPGWALVNLSGEGVFLLDLRNNASRLLYGYGGSPFRIVASNHGEIALFVPGSGKIYVFTPGART